MRIVFFGTGAPATPAFEALVRSGHEVVGLVTEPDRAGDPGPEGPAGAWRIPVLEPDDAASPGVADFVRGLAPDLIAVVGYRRALPIAVIRLPPRGTVKAQLSLLPRHRGPAPVPWTILSGDARAGVTTLLMDGGIDTGPRLLARSTEVAAEETAGELAFRLARLAAEALVETLEGLAASKITPAPQESAGASEAPLIDASLARIDWSFRAEMLARRVRAVSPTPGASAQVQGTTLKILRAVPAGEATVEPGVIQSVGFEGVVVACGEGTALRLTQLQPEGLRPMSPSALISRLRLQRGTRFD